ncbi:MAG: DUF2235 domain-containing protein [Amaricoccus sp.]|uniref:phospholipase effector Tle1 domain-containing protein n=1 Tax=Amaricoccus sp. TaxID=1872485 RepID=UPI0039E21DC3
MKRIVIACDGTWNRLDAPFPTNVAKLARAVLPIGPHGVPQIVCHLDGVGSGRGTGRLARGADRLLGGALGVGLTATLEEAYRFLVFAYAPGDEIHLLGFSRGAFMARSLAGMVRTCGILERRNAPAIGEALALYRDRVAAGGADGAAAMAFRARHAAHVTTGPREAAWRAESGLPAGLPLAIAYLGVWDTVGALGIPSHFTLAARLNRGLAFHDTALSRLVRAARHAVAIDERRRTFPPTLWANLDGLNRDAGRLAYAQRWFPGDHGSVGGGGPVTDLSDDALVWIADGATDAGLALDPAAVAAWRRSRNPLGPLRARPRPSLLWRLMALDAHDRAGPWRFAELAEAAVRRWHADPAYRPRPLRRLQAVLTRGR